MSGRRKRGMLVAALGGGLGLLAAYFGTALLGGLTGVIAPCSTAPGWWVSAYLALAVVVIPSCAIWSAVAARRAYLKRHAEVSPSAPG